MIEHIEEIFEKDCGLVKDRQIIVGVSGGPDSLCLMEALRQAGYSLLVAYFDHQLRPESSLDARAVEKTAARLMIPCIVDGADVRQYAEEKKLSIEEAARELRYGFLFDLARRRNAQAVAVGHTADDQVETILMHFLRGSGMDGLRGMAHRSINKMFDTGIPIVRPLLNFWREQTVVYCAVNGLRARYDPSNDSLNFLRNRIRHLLIPNLETYNPRFREAILRMSQLMRDEHALVRESIENAWERIVLAVEKDFITFDFSQLAECSLGLQRNLIKQTMQILRPGADVTFAVLERAVDALRSNAVSVRVDLKAGLRLFREANRVYISTLDAELPFDLWPQVQDDTPLVFELPSQLALAGGWKVNCERWHIPALAWEQAERNEDQFQVWLDAGKLPNSFILRTRRQGDQFAPLGMGGHSMKLSDFFVNEKIPQRARDRWPLLCAGDEIVWVPGYRSAHPYRLTEATQNIVYFSMTRPPETIATDETPRQD
jgi:tRNA(Ile)-lysidine synthase